MNILSNIRNYSVLDSEIIQKIEFAKYNSRNFDINWKDNRFDFDNWSLLMYAVYYHRVKLVEYLLTYPDIDINYASYGGTTALHLAYCLPILKILLSRKDLDVNRNQCVLLYYACSSNNIKIIRELLLDARANVIIRIDCGMTPRHIAIRNEHPEITNILKRTEYTSLLRIPNKTLLYDIIRMIIEEYT